MRFDAASVVFIVAVSMLGNQLVKLWAIKHHDHPVAQAILVTN